MGFAFPKTKMNPKNSVKQKKQPVFMASLANPVSLKTEPPLSLFKFLF